MIQMPTPSDRTINAMVKSSRKQGFRTALKKFSTSLDRGRARVDKAGHDFRAQHHAQPPVRTTAQAD